MENDASLLRLYADTHSEEAFAEFVRRNLGFVYSVAMQHTGGDAHRAKDIAQIVFASVARDPGSLAKHQRLLGWLHSAARNAAINSVRTEIRRRRREEEAQVALLLTTASPSADWDQIRPALHEAIVALDPGDREAVLLRYFGQRPFLQVGTALGLSEEAARKRTERAVEKLRKLLEKRGIRSAAAALAIWLEGQSAIAVPPGLTEAITASAFISAKAVSSPFLISFMSTSKMAAGTLCALIVAAGVIIWWQLRTNSQLEADLRRSSAQLLAGHPVPIGKSPAASVTTRRVSISRRSPNAVRSPLSAGIRGVGAFQYMGRSSAAAAFETEIWARESGDIDKLAACVIFNDAGRRAAQAIVDGMAPAQKAEYGTPERMAAMLGADNISHFSGAAIVAERQTGTAEESLDIELERVDGQTATVTWDYRQTDDGWKRIIPDHLVAGWQRYFEGGRSGSQKE